MQMLESYRRNVYAATVITIIIIIIVHCCSVVKSSSCRVIFSLVASHWLEFFITLLSCSMELNLMSFFISCQQNTVDKLVQRANASLLIGTSSWKEQFVEALTVNAGEWCRLIAFFISSNHSLSIPRRRWWRWRSKSGWRTTVTKLYGLHHALPHALLENSFRIHPANRWAKPAKKHFYIPRD